MISADELAKVRGKLNATTIRDRSDEIKAREIKETSEKQHIQEVTKINSEEARRQYFFDAGVEGWYNNLSHVTFPSSFVEIKLDEKHALLWKYMQRFAHELDSGETDEIKLILGSRLGDTSNFEKALEQLRNRLDEKIRTLNSIGYFGFFVKLSSRSPKDSGTILTKATAEYHRKLKESEVQGRIYKYTIDDNFKWALLAEEVRLASRCGSASSMLEILCDSERVGEDIKSALDSPTNIIPISVIIRPFDMSVTPQTEFRGFVWNGKFTCVGQYFHVLYFAELQGKSEIIARDLRKFYDQEVYPKLFTDEPDCFGKRVPCFMMDLVWRGENKEVSIVEINPFDGEALGTFPASTGLFSWDDIDGDRQIMTGRADSEFTIRLCETQMSESEASGNRNKEWSQIIQGS